MTTREAKPLNRNQETREETARKQAWKPASVLPDPTPEDGYKFRYIRKSMMGVTDPTNFSRKTREGWEPCRLQDHPELSLMVDTDAQASGLVEIGGLILCKMPTEMIEQRTDYINRNNQAQIDSVDNSFMRENDPRMPLFSDKKSATSFGKG